MHIFILSDVLYLACVHLLYTVSFPIISLLLHLFFRAHAVPVPPSLLFIYLFFLHCYYTPLILSPELSWLELHFASSSSGFDQAPDSRRGFFSLCYLRPLPPSPSFFISVCPLYHTTVCPFSLFFILLLIFSLCTLFLSLIFIPTAFLCHFLSAVSSKNQPRRELIP